MSDRILRASRVLPPGLLAAALCLVPRLALACPVCSGGQKESVGKAYLYGALTMSVIPLIAATIVVLFVRRRARALAAPAPARSAVSAAGARAVALP